MKSIASKIGSPQAVPTRSLTWNKESRPRKRSSSGAGAFGDASVVTRPARTCCTMSESSSRTRPGTCGSAAVSADSNAVSLDGELVARTRCGTETRYDPEAVEVTGLRANGREERARPPRNGDGFEPMGSQNAARSIRIEVEVERVKERDDPDAQRRDDDSHGEKDGRADREREARQRCVVEVGLRGHGRETTGATAARYSSRRRAATKASCGTSTRPICFIRFLPSFWRSSSLRLRVMSPP